MTFDLFAPRQKKKKRKRKNAASRPAAQSSVRAAQITPAVPDDLHHFKFLQSKPVPTVTFRRLMKQKVGAREWPSVKDYFSDKFSNNKASIVPRASPRISSGGDLHA